MCEFIESYVQNAGNFSSWAFTFKNLVTMVHPFMSNFMDFFFQSIWFFTFTNLMVCKRDATFLLHKSRNWVNGSDFCLNYSHSLLRFSDGSHYVVLSILVYYSVSRVAAPFFLRLDIFQGSQNAISSFFCRFSYHFLTELVWILSSHRF